MVLRGRGSLKRGVIPDIKEIYLIVVAPCIPEHCGQYFRLAGGLLVNLHDDVIIGGQLQCWFRQNGGIVVFDIHSELKCIENQTRMI